MRIRTHGQESSSVRRRRTKNRPTQRRRMAEVLENRLLLATVTSEDPVANSHTAAVSTNVAATFDEVINGASATAQTFVVNSEQGGRLTGVAVSAADMTITLDPAADFLAGDMIEVTATAGIQGTSAGVKRVWQFRTAPSGGLADFSDSGQDLGVAANNTQSYGVDVGDLDGDGDLDVFVANQNDGSQVFLNSGGIFSDSGQSLGSTTSRDIALGDLDGDGDLDAVVANTNNQGNRVWTNDGSGVFTQTQNFGTGLNRGITLGDIDGDGDLDAFIVQGRYYPRAYLSNTVWMNNGSGTFSDSNQQLGNSNSAEVALGDVDGDGDLDAVIANDSTPNRVWLNNGNGGFADSTQDLGFHYSWGVDLGDLDGDGDLDLMFANADYPNRVLINDGSGVFADTGQLLGGGDRNVDVRFGDFDADGDLDAFLAERTNGQNTVWLNDGSAVFTDNGQVFATGNTEAVILGDVDGDGDVDAVGASGTDAGGGARSPARVWLNQNPTTSVTLSVDTATIIEAGGQSSVTATLSGAAAQDVTVELGLTGSATTNDDYNAAGTQILITAGATTGAITVTAVDDTIDEPDETVVVDITSVTNASETGTQQVTVTILDDDEPIPVPDVILTVDNINIPENGGVATFTANLSEVTTVPITVDLAFSGMASAADFNASDTQIVLAAGSTSGSITIAAVDDAADEADESVIVEITNVTGGTELGVQQQATTIVDDDEPVLPDVTLAVDNGQIAEDGGLATLTVTLSEVTTVPVTVELGIAGTAAAADFTVSATEVVIAAGATTGTTSVTAVQDELNEPDESVIVDIINVIGGSELGDQQQTITILDDDVPPSFNVTSLVETRSGFRLEMSRLLDGSEINLFDTQNANRGPADVVVTGATSGPVSGSLIVEESAVVFIKSDGPFAADTYTVTLRSADNGFKDTSGALLDGDGDGAPGDDYASDFTIDEAPANARTIQIPDFVRGPGQAVNLPADETAGIPISISDGDNVRAVDLRISYDPGLLEITDAAAPGGGTVVLNTTTPGLAILVYFNSSSLPAGPSTFISLEASVPADNASGNYRRQQVLDIHEVVVGDGNDNEFSAVVDDALHLATFFSDVSGNGRTNAGDASQVARFAALIDSGFSSALNTDPILVGDVSGNGRINAADASLVARFAALIPVDQIPDIPGGVLIAGVSPVVAPPKVDLPTRPNAQESAASKAADLGSTSSFVIVDFFSAQSQAAAVAAKVDASLADQESLLPSLESAIDELFEE